MTAAAAAAGACTGKTDTRSPAARSRSVGQYAISRLKQVRQIACLRAR